MTDFNSDAFMMTDQDGDFDTVEPELPEADYSATVEDVTPRVTSTNKPALVIRWRLDDEVVQRIFNNEKGLAANQWVVLTTTTGEINGPLDKKHNQQLAKILKALGLEGQRWQPSMLIGRAAKVHAMSEEGEGDFEGQRFYRIRWVEAI